MREKQVDPHYYLVDLIADTSTHSVVIGSGITAAIVEMPLVSIDHKLQAAKELAQYLQPKLRATEVSGGEGGPLRFQIEMVSYNEDQTAP